jgi:hypothetical protein
MRSTRSELKNMLSRKSMVARHRKSCGPSSVLLLSGEGAGLAKLTATCKALPQLYCYSANNYALPKHCLSTTYLGLCSVTNLAQQLHSTVGDLIGAIHGLIHWRNWKRF